MKRTRIISVIIIGIASLIAIVYSIIKALNGKEVGLIEVATIGWFLRMFFYAITWGSKTAPYGGRKVPCCPMVPLLCILFVSPLHIKLPSQPQSLSSFEK